jgi:predicted RNA-binding protein
MKFWVLSGSLNNWDKGISDNIWGVRVGLKKSWEKLQKGDMLIFYVTNPISGVIGIGSVEDIFEQKNPLWPDEIKENKVIYPYRFEFKVLYIVPKPNWNENKINIKDLKINYRAGLNPLANKESIKTFLERIDTSWNTKFGEIIKEEKIIESIIEIKPRSLHDDIKNRIKEIGEIEGFISEIEYSEPPYRFDVVWRSSKVVGGVPKYVFEVQIGGDIQQALAKLKHAYDKWGFPRLFLICNQEDVNRVNQYLGGTFHEIKDRLNVILVEKIVKLHEIQTEDFKLKKEIGLS